MTLKTHYRYDAARLLDSWWDRTTGLLTEPREILRSARKESGIILFGFVALHMIGNLKSLLGDEADGMAGGRRLRPLSEDHVRAGPASPLSYACSSILPGQVRVSAVPEGVTVERIVSS